jgi:hypothetical protein
MEMGLYFSILINGQVTIDDQPFYSGVRCPESPSYLPVFGFHYGGIEASAYFLLNTQ